MNGLNSPFHLIISNELLNLILLNSSSNEFPSTCVFKLNTRVEMKDERVNKMNQIEQSEIELPLDYLIGLNLFNILNDRIQ